MTGSAATDAASAAWVLSAAGSWSAPDLRPVASSVAPDESWAVPEARPSAPLTRAGPLFAEGARARGALADAGLHAVDRAGDLLAEPRALGGDAGELRAERLHGREGDRVGRIRRERGAGALELRGEGGDATGVARNAGAELVEAGAAGLELAEAGGEGGDTAGVAPESRGEAARAARRLAGAVCELGRPIRRLTERGTELAELGVDARDVLLRHLGAERAHHAVAE